MSSKAIRFASLLEAVPDALVGMSQAGVIRFVNRQTELLFGYDRDDLVGRQVETLVPENLWQVYADHQEGYFADPRARAMGLDLELSGRHADGTDFPVNVSVSPIDTGDILLVITAVLAVTRQRKALENSKRMTAIIEYSDDAIVGLTLKGIITSWNPAAEKMFGYTRTTIIGKSVELLSPKDRTGAIHAALDKIGAGQHVDHFESIGVREDGTAIAVSLSVSPIRDEDVAIVGASTITRNLTGQMQPLAASRSMIESSLDSWVTISPAGRITDANQATVKVTGVPREQLIGTAFSSYFTEPDKANEIYQLVFAKGMAVDYPLTMRHQDGRLTDVLYNASVQRDDGGNVLGVFAAARDVTKLSEALRASRSLIESSLDSWVAISPAGRITGVNEATVKVTGVSREQLIGTAFSTYFTEPDKANEIYQRVFGREMAVDYPLTMRHEKGTLTDVLYNASVYRGTTGKVLGVFATARDVTKQRQAQRDVVAHQAKELGRLADLELFDRA